MPLKKKTPDAPVSASARALTAFEVAFAKSFGVGTLIHTSVINPYEVISTGSLTIDYALGVGGFVEGRLHEIWGVEGGGKTTLMLGFLAEAQKKHPDKHVAFVDVEQKMDAKWAAQHGVDLNRLYLYRPNNAEDVADAVKDLIRSKVISGVVIDSIGAMIPEKEKEKDAGDAVVGKQAQVVTRMVKIAASEAPKTNTTVVFINQVRANIGYGADTTTGGGFALKHATTTRLKVRRTGTPPFTMKIAGETEPIVVGHEIAVKVERNGVAPAYRSAILCLFHVDTDKYGPLGIDRAAEAVSLGIKTGVIKQRGGWYDTPDGGKHNGQEALKEILRGDLTLQEQVREQVLATVAGTIHEDETSPEEIVEQDAHEALAPKFRTSGSIEADQ